MDLKLENNILILPKASLKDDEIAFDLRNVNSALSRQEEVSIVTKDKAPELMSTFLKAYTDAKKYSTVAKYQLERARITQKRIYAILAKDKVPDMLKQLCLKDTKANYDLLINLDPEYQRAEELSALMDAILEDLNGKAKALEMLYQAVKKVYASFEGMPYGSNTNSIIGKAKY